MSEESLFYEALAQPAAERAAFLEQACAGQPQLWAAVEAQWDSRGHFFAAAAAAMRRILVDNPRHKLSRKAGHGRQRRPLDDVEATVGASPDDQLALDEALTKLERELQAAADLAKLRLFIGLTVDEAADALRISRRTGFRLWTYARAWLQAELSADDPFARA